jgi:hypothetical protein
MVFIPSIASSVLGSSAKLLGSSALSSTSSKDKVLGGETEPDKKYDVQAVSKYAGEELIKQICKTLNSPENKLFARVVDNSVKSYFSENNADVLNPTMIRIFNLIIDELSKPIFQDSNLNKHLIVHFIQKHKDVLNQWINQSIKLVSIPDIGIDKGNAPAQLPDTLLYKYAVAIVDEICNTDKVIEWEQRMQGGKMQRGSASSRVRKTLRSNKKKMSKKRKAKHHKKRSFKKRGKKGKNSRHKHRSKKMIYGGDGEEGESVSEPVVESVSAPAVESVSEPVVESVSAPAVESVSEPVVESVSAPAVESVSEPVVEDNYNDNHSDDHAVQDNNKDEHALQDNHSDEHAVQDNNKDEHAVQDNNKDEHAVQDNNKDEHAVQDNNKDEHAVQDNHSDDKQNNKIFPSSNTNEMKNTLNDIQNNIGSKLQSYVGKKLESGLGKQLQSYVGKKLESGVGKQLQSYVGKQLESGVGKQLQSYVGKQLENGINKLSQPQIQSKPQPQLQKSSSSINTNNTKQNAPAVQTMRNNTSNMYNNNNGYRHDDNNSYRHDDTSYNKNIYPSYNVSNNIQPNASTMPQQSCDLNEVEQTISQLQNYFINGEKIQLNDIKQYLYIIQCMKNKLYLNNGNRATTGNIKNNNNKMAYRGGAVGVDGAGGADAAVTNTPDSSPNLENIEKSVNQLQTDFVNGKKTQSDTIKEALPIIETIKNKLYEKKNQQIVAKQNNSSSGGPYNSAVSCDDIMDHILKGKQLNEQEKTILNYMDFRFKKDSTQYAINSSIMYIIENALRKQLTTNTMKESFQTHFDKIIPALITPLITDVVSANNTPSSNMLIVRMFVNLISGNGTTNIKPLVHTCIMNAFRSIVENDTTLNKTIMFNNGYEILHNIETNVGSKEKSSTNVVSSTAATLKGGSWGSSGRGSSGRGSSGRGSSGRGSSGRGRRRDSGRGRKTERARKKKRNITRKRHIKK